MKKSAAIFLFCICCISAAVLSGCGSVDRQKQAEYKELGIYQLESGKYKDAAESFQKALDQSYGRVGAEEIDISYYKALALFKSGDFSGAIGTYDGLIEYDKDNWEAYYLRGGMYVSEGDIKQAIEDYGEAISKNKSDIELYANICISLSDAGYEEETAGYLEDALGIKVSGAKGLGLKGYIYYLQGDYENALECLNQAADRGYDEALSILGRVYTAMGESDEAEAVCRQYLEEYPDDPEVLGALGGIALEAEDYENALTWLSDAIELYGESGEEVPAEIERERIAAYEYSGDYESAFNAAKDYLETYPGDEEVQREYTFLSTRVD